MLKKILLIENNEFLGEILETNLQVYLNAKIERRKTLREASVYISKSTPSLIITKDEVNDIFLPQTLYKTLENKGEKVPMIVMGEISSKIPGTVCIGDPTDIKGIISTAAKILKITAEHMSKLAVSAYYPVHLKLFNPGFVSTCDLFISIAGKYEKVVDKGEKISKEFLNDMETSSVFDFYVDSLSRLEIVNGLTSFLFNKLADDNLTLEERVEVTSKSYELIQDTINKVGVDPHTAALAEASLASLDKIVAKVPDLKSILDSLKGQDTSFRYMHSVLCTYIGFKIITQTRWGNKEQQDKFAFVSLFHDITLTKDEYAKVANQEDLDALNLTPEEALKIENHALNAAKLVSKYRKLPFGVDTIIKQHHGTRDGKGFNNISGNISPLAVMFIFAEEWATLALTSMEKNIELDKGKIIEYLKSKYNVPKFRQFLPLLEKLNI